MFIIQHASPLDVDSFLVGTSANLGPGLAINYYYPFLQPFNDLKLNNDCCKLFFFTYLRYT